MELAMHFKAEELIKAWNKMNLCDKRYFVVSPFKVKDRGEHCVGEDFIEGEWEKWNSNSGYVSRSTASVQAFCHWTYHHSDGQLLMCDVQGVSNGMSYCITDPCICSTSQVYGQTDVGIWGINAFFANHVCNQFCNSGWMKPMNNRSSVVFPKMKASTYRWEVSNDESVVHPEKAEPRRKNILPKKKGSTYRWEVPKSGQKNILLKKKSLTRQRKGNTAKPIQKNILWKRKSTVYRWEVEQTSMHNSQVLKNSNRRKFEKRRSPIHGSVASTCRWERMPKPKRGGGVLTKKPSRNQREWEKVLNQFKANTMCSQMPTTFDTEHV